MNTLSPNFVRFIFVIFFLAFSSGAVATGQLFLNTKKKDLIDNLVEIHGFHLAIAELALRNDWHYILTDLFFLANTPDLSDAFDDALIPGSQQHIEEIFHRFLDANQIYHKIRLIDVSGQEMVKVRYASIWDAIDQKSPIGYRNQPKSHMSELLQDKSNKYYFLQTKQLKRGEVYVSPFDLNTEFDQTIAELPTIRFSTPIYSKNDILKGILILSYNGMHLLNNFKNTLPMGIDASLLNEEGYWFHRKDNQHLFGFAVGDNHTYEDEFPETWPIVKSSTSGVVENKEGLILYREFRPFRETTPNLADPLLSSPQGKSPNDLSRYHWKIVVRVPPEELQGKLNPIRRGIQGATGVTIVLLALFFTTIYLWIRRRIQEQEDTQAELAAQNVFHELQILAYQNNDLQTKLNRFLEKLFSLPWLGPACHGVIIMPGEAFLPRLAAAYPFSEAILPQCITADPSSCQCRKAFAQYGNESSPSWKPNDNIDIGYADCRSFPAWNNNKLEAVLGISNAPHHSARAPQERFIATSLSFLQNIAQLLADMITRHHAMEELGKLQRAVEQSPASVVITDIDGKIEYVNHKFCTVSGYTAREVIGQTPRLLKSGQMAESLYKEMWQTILDNKEWHGEFCNRRKDGSFFWESALITPIRNAQGQVTNFLALKEDITDEKHAMEERQSLEKQLRQAQKMESIGHLTGGIAHDFNNILAAIKGFSELALTRFATDEKSKLHAYLRNILTASDRARDLIAQMLLFSRTRETATQRVFIEPLVKEVVKLMRATLPTSISITCTFADPSYEIAADPVQLHQVLMNLFVNARDAMNHKGRLDISVFRHPGESHACSSCHTPFYSDGMVIITVQDDGPGIPAAIQPKIFDPFFTTKEVGQGTGMGLAMVHGIVHSCSGHVVLQSSPQQGTAFRLYFQETRHAKAPRAAKPTVAGAPLPLLHGHILLVDDEASIVEFLREFLEGEGFTVTSRTSSLEALIAFESAPHHYDLLLTDHTMPDMTGLELIHRVLSIRPELPVILCTGYSREVNESSAADHGIRHYLQKPMEIAKLHQSLLEIFTGRT